MFTSGGFGVQRSASGTVMKYTPVTSTDSLQKGGYTNMINTKFHAITCMQVYESKSFEELRSEDYSANRKGPQQISPFGAPSLAFKAPEPAPQFRQLENKSIFGTATSFRQTPAFGQPSTSTSYGKPNPEPYWAQSLLGTAKPQPSNSCSATNFIRQQPATQQSSSFFKPTQPAISTVPQTGMFAIGRTPDPTTPTGTLFQPAKSFTLSNENTCIPATTGNSSGNINASSKPAQSTFAQSTPSFESTSMSNKCLFGDMVPQPSVSLLTGSNLPNNTMMAANNPYSLQSQQQPSIELPQRISSETTTIFEITNPYHFAPCLRIEPVPPIKSFHTHYVTNPKELYSIVQSIEAKDTPLPKKIKIKDHDDRLKAQSTDEKLMESYRLDTKTLGKFNQYTQSKRRLYLKDSSSLHNPEPIELHWLIKNTHMSVLRDNIAKKGANGDNANESTTTKTVNSASVQTCEKGTFVDPDMLQKMSKCPVTGVVCTRPDYYTIPELSKIKDYKTDDSSCYIKGFTIGRIGYGNVYFPDSINVLNLNIDELVHFCFRQLTIYPDDDNKPPLGEGLNQRAQITLDGCYPNGTSDVPFFEILKSACILANTSFLEYREDTGSWVFNVTHFSKYGLLQQNEPSSQHARYLHEQQVTNEVEENKVSTHVDMVVEVKAVGRRIGF